VADARGSSSETSSMVKGFSDARQIAALAVVVMGVTRM
jgi:hypothetical protein